MPETPLSISDCARQRPISTLDRRRIRRARRLHGVRRCWSRSTRQVTPLCSTYFNVIGDEVDWGEITVLFAGSGVDWDGASFFPVTTPRWRAARQSGGAAQLRELEARLDDDRLVLNEGHFFDKWGRRMMVEEIAAQ